MAAKHEPDGTKTLQQIHMPNQVLIIGVAEIKNLANRNILRGSLLP